MGTEGPWTARPRDVCRARPPAPWGSDPRHTPSHSDRSLHSWGRGGRQWRGALAPERGLPRVPAGLLSDTRTPCAVGGTPWGAQPGGKSVGGLDGHDPMTLSSRRLPWIGPGPLHERVVWGHWAEQRSSNWGLWGPGTGTDTTALPCCRVRAGSRQSAYDGEQVPGRHHG